MECKHCGAKLSIEDQYCPFCGYKNEEAAQHTADMNQFKHEFVQTRGRVYGMTNRLGVSFVLVVIIILLAAANALVMFGEVNAYSLVNSLEKKSVAANADKNYNRMSQMEEDGDYTGMYMYYNLHKLWLSDRTNEFNAVTEAADHYDKLFQSLLDLGNPFGSREDADNSLKQCGASIEVIEACLSKKYTINPDCYKNVHMKSIENIGRQMEDLLKAYGRFTEEDLEAVRTASGQSATLILGRRLGLYE